MIDYDGFNYEKFKELACNDTISVYQKIGFPDSYRNKCEKFIWQDIKDKCPILKTKHGIKVLNIGPGCSNLQKMISDWCQKMDDIQILADSPEMLELLPEHPKEIKVPGLFPETYEEIKEITNGVDVIICYSVFQYIFVDSNVWFFLDCVLDLLNEGGKCILGDIPNIDKRKRFFASPSGVSFHQKFMHTKEIPNIKFNCLERGVIDESMLFALIHKCHSSGYDAYILPQDSRLPFANRRDDIIIRRL